MIVRAEREFLKLTRCQPSAIRMPDAKMLKEDSIMNHTTSESVAARGSTPMPLQGILVGSGSLCRLCSRKLRREDGDDFTRRLCTLCKDDPAADELLPLAMPCEGDVREPTIAPIAAVPHASRSPFANMVADVTGEGVSVTPSTVAFNDADLALIRRIGAFMPMQKLLDVLNERRACDHGVDKAPYSIEQLAAAIADMHGAKDPTALGRDWPSLRKLLAQARRAGVLEQINNQVIDDFAVVFQLNAKQVVELKDIVLGAKEE